METTPLEALIVKPGEVLILRMDTGESVELYSALEWVESAGLSDRVLIVDKSVELAVVERQQRHGT